MDSGPGDAGNDIEAITADLDADQRAAVTTESRLVAVIAGAGSGKTRVLTRRIAYRLAEESADPGHTLALTFTREAAGELRRRLRRLGYRDAVEAGTFHSVMLGVLRQRWGDTDRAPRTVTSERRRYLSEVIGGDGRAPRSDIEVADAEIGWAAAQGWRAADYPEQARRSGRRPTGGVERVATWFEGYEQLKRKRGVIDFDDVLRMTLEEARSDPTFADALRWRYRHVLVDEAQDLNPLQHAIVELLRDGNNDLFLVGDPSQAIYGFNGADPAMLIEVETRFPGIEVIRLPVNHRCTPQIVSAGVHVLRTGGQPTELRSNRPDGPTVEVVAADDEHDEANRIARQISRGDAHLVRSSNVAVLARTNAQLRPIAEALTAAGLEVKRSNAAGSPIQAAVRQAAGNSSPNALRGWAHDVLDDIALLDTARAGLARAEQTKPGRSERAVRAAVADARAILERVEAERRVATALLDFLRDHPRGDGAAFRSWVATTSPFERDHPGASDGGVELLSFHASKGREWHTVYVAGVETSLVPHKSATTEAGRAEEARLLYVAVTRATDQLVLTRAARRQGYERRPSLLVAELDTSDAVPAPPPRALLRQRRDRSTTTERALHEWRADAARRANVLPAQLCSDRDLASIAAKRPQSAEELVAVTSMGAMTAERLAPELLPLVADDA